MAVHRYGKITDGPADFMTEVSKTQLRREYDLSHPGTVGGVEIRFDDGSRGVATIEVTAHEYRKNRFVVRGWWEQS